MHVPQTIKTETAENETIIRPKKGIVGIDFHELWRYRELLFFLAWRDVLIRYKQAAIGILWAVIQPVVTMIVFTVIFGKLAKLPSNDVPYSIMTLAAILPWLFFSTALTQGSNSVVGAQAMVQKIYFPRLYIPMATMLAATVDFAISLVILFGMMLWFQVPFRVEFLLLPVFFGVAFLSALGLSLFFSALNVKYRDVRLAMPFVVRIGMYISPVGFMSSVIPDKWRFWYSLNPIVGVIDGFRWAILGDRFVPYWPGFWASIAVTALMFAVGIYFFRYTEKTFADII